MTIKGRPLSFFIFCLLGGGRVVGFQNNGHAQKANNHALRTPNTHSLLASIEISPLQKKDIFPVVIDSRWNQQWTTKTSLEQIEARATGLAPVHSARWGVYPKPWQRMNRAAPTHLDVFKTRKTLWMAVKKKETTRRYQVCKGLILLEIHIY